MIRVGLIGCGAIARHSHVPAWLKNSHATVVALCDVDRSAMETLRTQNRLDCTLHHSVSELLAASSPDVVDICTPGHLHFEQAAEALEAGAHVLIEKPPTLSLADAETLIRLGQARGRCVGGILNLREYDILREAKQAIDAGLLGKVTKVEVIHHGGNVYAESPALWNEVESKYLLYDFGIHFIDAMIFLGGPVKRVVHVWPRRSAFTGETTDLHVLLEFESGALGSFEITADYTLHSSHVTRIDVFGTAMDLFVRRFPPSVRLAAGIHNPLEILAEEAKAIWRIVGKVLTGDYLRWRNISHQRVIDAYVDWVRGCGQYTMRLEDCLPTMRVLAEVEAQIPAYAGAGRTAKAIDTS
jgi:predicted dehydrogenase